MESAASAPDALELVLTSPRFNRVEIRRGSGRTITILSRDAKMSFLRFCLFSVFLGTIGDLFALEYVAFRQDGKTRQVEGRFVLEATDAVVLESRDGRIYKIDRIDLLERKSDEVPFTPFSKKDVKVLLQEEFPTTSGFNLHETSHFLVVYNTSQEFAQWFGQLFEKLDGEYTTYWKKKGVPLEQHDYPLVAVVLADRGDFVRYAASEGVAVNDEFRAYFNPATNRMVMYDISGLEAARRGQTGRVTSRTVQEFLRRPDAERNISAVVHETTHQIGFNRGMHQRFAPCPLWVCEGLALLHEVPDIDKRGGWTIKPKINTSRLVRLKQFFQQKPADPIRKLILDDKLLKEGRVEEILDNYALAWGLTYYFVQKRPKEFAEYLKRTGAKTLLSEDTSEIRLHDFEECFGSDWNKLYADCLAFWGKL